MLRFSLVSRFVSVTFALAMAAPLLSLTVPAMVPYTFWPHPELAANSKTTVATTDANTSFLRLGISCPPTKVYLSPLQLPRGRTSRRHFCTGVNHFEKSDTYKKSHRHPAVGQRFRPIGRTCQVKSLF